MKFKIIKNALCSSGFGWSTQGACCGCNFGHEANDEFIWKVCHQAMVDDEPQEGWDELPTPMLYPRRHREFLRAIVAVKCGISFYRVNLKALDAAYSVAFPSSTPINVNKKASPLTPLRGEGN